MPRREIMVLTKNDGEPTSLTSVGSCVAHLNPSLSRPLQPAMMPTCSQEKISLWAMMLKHYHRHKT
jgi:hypothetical protein